MNTNNLPPLPNISKEEREFLHYNQNTDDLILWVMGYAAQYGQLCRQQALKDAEKLCKAKAEACLSLQNTKDSDNLNDVLIRHHAVAHNDDSEAIGSMK